MDNENKESKESENFNSRLDETTSNDETDEPAMYLMLQQFVSGRLNRHCVHARRISGGANNKIYLLQFVNQDCIARFSRDQTHPAAKLTNEIATNHQYKMPKVYGCTAQNSIKLHTSSLLSSLG